ncbi:MAG: epoxyqueuosine reductase [Clostridiales bacterium]|nr:epoxyqueuosine reductase [Clostridiales bacterium]
MDTGKMEEFISWFQGNDPGNRIPEDLAKKPEYAGRKLYDGVVLGVAAADDPVIVSLKNNSEANLDIMLPDEWLPGAKSVISFFFPFARWLIEENIGGEWPSEGWLHGRIEGQKASDDVISALAEAVREEGYEAVVPSLDPRLMIYMKYSGYPESLYRTNWSERHAAYAAGLGTFGLSRGLITERGTAGRFASLVTTMRLEPTPRYYTDLLEYCAKCGACARYCPPGAISVEHLKDHSLCDVYLAGIREKEEPYYGCGKCQCGVPCSYERPAL